MASISPERRAMLDKEKARNAGGNNQYFTTKNLTQAIIRLTPLLPDEQVGTKVVMYFINNRSYICNEATHGKPGVIARTIRALSRLDTDAAKELVKGLEDNRKSRFLTKIIVRGQEADGVKFFEMPRSIYDVIYEAFDKDGEDLSHPLEGRDIRISKTGSGLSTEYSARIKDASPLMPSKEERQAIRAQAQSMTIANEVAADEAAALEALQSVIPPAIWAQIEGSVLDGLNIAGADKPKAKPSAAVVDEGEGDEPAPAPASDEDEAPKAQAPKVKAATPAASDEDTPAPTPAKAASKPVAAEPADADEDTPIRTPKAPAKAAPAAAAAPKARYQAASSDDE